MLIGKRIAVVKRILNETSLAQWISSRSRCVVARIHSYYPMAMGKETM